MPGGPDAEAEQAAAEYGAFDYLMKPLAFEKLQDSTTRAIELRRRHAEALSGFQPWPAVVEPAAPEREVAGRDGRREAVVERLRDPQPGVNRVPARALDRELVQPQLARVEQAEQVEGAFQAHLLSITPRPGRAPAPPDPRYP